MNSTTTVDGATWIERANDWISETRYPTHLAAARAAETFETRLRIIASTLQLASGEYVISTAYRPDSRQN